MRPIRAPVCVLEPLVAAHAGAMFEVLSDPAIYEFENLPPPSPAWLADRYARLESRLSTDGTQRWLNWVVRLPNGALAGYVQATVLPSRACFIAYELASRHWRRGIGSAAVTAMLDELEAAYGVCRFLAALKAANYRSLGLLGKLGFAPAGARLLADHPVDADEVLMVKDAAPA